MRKKDSGVTRNPAYCTFTVGCQLIIGRISMEIFYETLMEEWYGLIRMLPRLIAAVIAFGFSIILGRFLGNVIAKIISRGNFKTTHRSFFRGLTQWLIVFLGIVVGLNVLGLKGLATGLVAGGGITAVVLGFAFREIGENLLAGFFLAFSRPFDIGDLIQSSEFQGTVKSIDLRSTHIRTADGCDIYIPSSEIFNKPLINFTKDGLRRISFKLGIDYADDSEKARKLLEKSASEAAHVLKDPAPGAIFSGLLSQYVELEVFFWIDTFEKGADLGSIRNEVIERCRRILFSEGFTVSANVTSNIALGNYQPFVVQLNPVSQQR